MRECEYYHQCLNNSKCYRCMNEQLLKLPKQAKSKVKRQRYSQPASSKKDSWEELEDRVAEQLNKVPTMKDARRARASGALWWEKGDVLDTLLHCECKERQGKELQGGNKSISIQRLWLEKAKDEIKYGEKIMCLPFRFKEDESIYAIFDFNDIAELVQVSKAYMKDNEMKQKEIELLKTELKKYVPTE